MSAWQDPPARPLRFLTYLVTDFVAIFVTMRAFGLIAGFAYVALLSYAVKPRETRARAWGSLALAAAVIAVGGTKISSTMNVLRVWEGVPSPAFTLTTLAGDPLTSAELRGKRIALNFWATWCGPCQLEVPELNRLFQENGAADVVVVGISDEPPETIRAFLATTPVDYPIVSIADAALPSPYRDVFAYPTTFVVDRNGIIQTVRAGYVMAGELQRIIWDAPDYDGPIQQPPVKE